MSSETAYSKRIPAYSEFFYGDIYNSPSKTASRDKPLSVHLRTFFQDEKMLQQAINLYKQGIIDALQLHGVKQQNFAKIDLKNTL